MNVPAPVAATPSQIAGSITRAWFAFFIAMAVIGLALSFITGGIYSFVARSMADSLWVMRYAVWGLGLVINAPISFFVFHWAVRGKVLPAVLDWNGGAGS